MSEIEYKVNESRLVDRLSCDSFQYDLENPKSYLKKFNFKMNQIEKQQNPRYRYTYDLKGFLNLN